MSLRMYFLATLVLGMALALLSHFGSIWLFRDFTIGEPNTLILTAETVLMFSIMCFSLFCIFKEIREGRTHKTNK